ncbi:hypothetical protein RIR_jg5955.t1 [Rhizophagus irregularis DAOM 181602=DAOM 197198]|nr:hypothetical protein RIR_jg5955.t1 [Rhizophagus irregularis DAOM 181602=DAOM 197198]
MAHSNDKVSSSIEEFEGSSTKESKDNLSSLGALEAAGESERLCQTRLSGSLAVFCPRIMVASVPYSKS